MERPDLFRVSPREFCDNEVDGPYLWEGHGKDEHIENEVGDGSGLEVRIIKLAQRRMARRDVPVDAMMAAEIEGHDKEGHDPRGDNGDKDDGHIMEDIATTGTAKDPAVEEQGAQFCRAKCPYSKGIDGEVYPLYCGVLGIDKSDIFRLLIANELLPYAYVYIGQLGFGACERDCASWCLP